jgi:hypothetical protein
MRIGCSGGLYSKAVFGDPQYGPEHVLACNRSVIKLYSLKKEPLNSPRADTHFFVPC